MKVVKKDVEVVVKHKDIVDCISRSGMFKQTPFSRRNAELEPRTALHVIDIADLGTATLHFEPVVPVQQAEVRTVLHLASIRHV